MKNTPLRSERLWKQYLSRPKRKWCFLCAETTTKWGYWRVIPNQYPYDNIAEKHDLLTPVRHVATEAELTAEETAELRQIKAHLTQSGEYDVFWWNFPQAQTCPDHLHYHLLLLKRIDDVVR